MRPNIIRVQMSCSERTQYQFIRCRLMTHEIKKYLLQGGSAHMASVYVCVRICLGHGSHGNKQSILVSNCGGGKRRVSVRKVFICMPLPVYILYIYMCEISVIFLCVWQQDVQTDIQHGWSDLPSHSSDSSEGNEVLASGKMYILVYWTWDLLMGGGG